LYLLIAAAVSGCFLFHKKTPPGQTGPDGSTCPGGGTACFEWTQWPIPPDSPPDSQFTTDTNGNVLDSVTGLTWFIVVQNKGCPTDHSQGACTHDDAEDVCAQANVDGDPALARLPTLIELLTIVDFSKIGSGLVLDSTAFPDTLASPEWTASSSASDYWAIDMKIGQPVETVPGSGAWVRCVRASHASAPGLPDRYSYPDGTQADAQTVLDSATQLTWQRAVDTDPCPGGFGMGCDQSSAVAYCSNLTLAGAQWRLPTMKELASLVADSAANSLDPTAFPSVPMTSTTYWSSTHSLSWNYYSAVAIGPQVGFLPNPSDLALVRCVH
jgi:hypothetical protein